MSYEAAPRRHLREQEESEDDAVIERLPVKLADGRVVRTGDKIKQRPLVNSSEDDEDEDDSEIEHEVRPNGVEDVATGARFGRPAVVDVISSSSRKARIQAAKEQIASLCQDIIADPENSVRRSPCLDVFLLIYCVKHQLGLLRRLHTFSLAKISTPSHPEPVTNDVIIRKLAFLSQLAVFKDIIPGYRIRALTDKEKAEKVSQIVQRTRDFEQGLVSVYQSYLQNLETEIKGKMGYACFTCPRLNFGKQRRESWQRRRYSVSANC